MGGIVIDPSNLRHLSLRVRHAVACQYVADATEWAASLFPDDQVTRDALLKHAAVWRAAAEDDDDDDPDPGTRQRERHLRVHPGSGEGGDDTPSPKLTAVHTATQ
jgi:hypothetical protein